MKISACTWCLSPGAHCSLSACSRSICLHGHLGSKGVPLTWGLLVQQFLIGEIEVFFTQKPLDIKVWNSILTLLLYEGAYGCPQLRNILVIYISNYSMVS